MKISSTIILPKKISPCPIKEAIVELRFTPNPEMPLEVFLGLLYENLKEEFPVIPQKTPILDIPAAFRESNKDLKYAPHYQLMNNNFVLKVSPQSISISCKDNYQGWDVFFAFVKKVINSINELKISTRINRVGIRYISFFENIDIFEKIRIKLELCNDSLVGQHNRNALKNEFTLNDFTCVVQLNNSAVLNQIINGSSIDIDVIRENNAQGLKDIEKNIEDAHMLIKKIFFNLLSPEFLSELKPE